MEGPMKLFILSILCLAAIDIVENDFKIGRRAQAAPILRLDALDDTLEAPSGGKLVEGEELIDANLIDVDHSEGLKEKRAFAAQPDLLFELCRSVSLAATLPVERAEKRNANVGEAEADDDAEEDEDEDEEDEGDEEEADDKDEDDNTKAADATKGMDNKQAQPGDVPGQRITSNLSGGAQDKAIQAAPMQQQVNLANNAHVQPINYKLQQQQQQQQQQHDLGYLPRILKGWGLGAGSWVLG